MGFFRNLSTEIEFQSTSITCLAEVEHIVKAEKAMEVS